jgi:hypothetical protein
MQPSADIGAMSQVLTISKLARLSDAFRMCMAVPEPAAVALVTCPDSAM